MKTSLVQQTTPPDEISDLQIGVRVLSSEHTYSKLKARACSVRPRIWIPDYKLDEKAFCLWYRGRCCDSYSFQTLRDGHAAVPWEGIPHHASRNDKGDEKGENGHQLQVSFLLKTWSAGSRFFKRGLNSARQEGILPLDGDHGYKFCTSLEIFLQTSLVQYSCKVEVRLLWIDLTRCHKCFAQRRSSCI